MTLTTIGKTMNKRRRQHEEYIPTPKEIAERSEEIREKKLSLTEYIEKHPDLASWRFGELSITACADQRDFRQGCQFLGSGKWRTSPKKLS
jgi:hypothetical protein